MTSDPNESCAFIPLCYARAFLLGTILQFSIQVDFGLRCRLSPIALRARFKSSR